MIRSMLPSLAALLLAASALHAADEPKGTNAQSTSATGSEGSKALHDAMMKGMQPMHSMKPTGDTDQDFATMMLAHHQQAIDMSRAELKHGKDAEIRKKAQEIIAASEKDIADLKKWQGAH